MAEAAAARRVTFGDVLANPEFRAMYVAQALSVTGDQLARIAVALLVYSRSQSPLLTALTYAVTYLPWLLGGPLLGVYADRLPRREVMVACDVARAGVILVVAIPDVPIAVALLTVCVVSFLEPGFNAARSALLADIVPTSEEYAAASALGATVNQLGQVLGFGLGGALVATITPQGAIVADSATFLVSALLIAVFIHRRPRPLRTGDDAPGGRREAMRFVRDNRRVRNTVVMAYAAVAATIAPEAVAVPYAVAHGGGATAAGILTAAVPLGTMIGAVLVGRVLGQSRAEGWIVPLAFATVVIFAFTGFDPPVPLAFPLWVLGGATSAMIITSSALVARLTPADMRGRVFGLLGSGLAAVQGAAALLVGWLAESVGPAVAVADVALPMFAVLTVFVANQLNASRTPAFEPMAEGDQPNEDTVTKAAARRRPEPQMWAASGVLALVAAGLTLLVNDDDALVRVDVPTWWFFLLFLIVQAYPLQFEFRRTTRHVVLDSIALVLGLFFLPPLTLIAVRVAAKVLMEVARRKPPLRVAFNGAAGAFTSAVAVLLFHAVVPSDGSAHLAAWPAALLAVIVDDVAAAAVVTWPGYVYDRFVRIRSLIPPLVFSLAVNLVNACLGLVTVGAIVYDHNNAWMIALFMTLTLAGFRTYHELADRHAVLDRLYEFAKNVGPLTSDPLDLTPAMAQLRELLRAPQLTLALVRPGEPATLITATDEGISGNVRVDDSDVADQWWSEHVEPAAPRRWRWLRRWDTSSLTRSTMVVPVGEPDAPMAVLRAIATDTNSRVFDRKDMHLLRAVADQVGAALEKGRLIEGLRDAATRDSLTGLANLDTLRSFLSAMLAEQSGATLLLLDIDRFHDINDTVGHEAGDAVLVEVARRLEQAATHGSLACRVGGDQFALVIAGRSNSELARLAALAVKSRVDGSLRLDSVSADVRLTIGMARAPDHGDDATTILRRAEIAMGAAKGGTTGIGEWEPHLERDGSRRLYVLSGLRQALVESDLTVEFQPKLLLGTGEVTGFEALVRWRHPELGLVSPAEFIPLAEATGLIGALTSNVLRLSLEAARRWHDEGLTVGMAVNISARSLDDPVLVGQVAALLTASGLDGGSLTLEITESSVMENPTRSIDVLRQLRSLGVRLSIDDFGTGYSSLHQLRGLPVHEVKIDKTFVDNIDRDGADRAVVRAIVDLCDSLGLVTVAEGVEQAGQAYALAALGVTEVQGYFYGRPMPEADALAWLRPRAIAPKLSPEEQRG
jgi:diguanylate cyclase (GGDEF)-like protein